jgi:hypothetical protein
MTTLHNLRRKHALLFSQLAHETGISTRRLAAYEYHGDTLAPHEHRTLAKYFGVPIDFLEGRSETAHIARSARWSAGTRLGTQLQSTLPGIVAAEWATGGHASEWNDQRRIEGILRVEASAALSRS